MSLFLHGEFTVEISGDIAAIENRGTDGDFPYTNTDGSPLRVDQVHQHLAWNAVSNGVTDLSDLDGFADWERGRATMRVTRVEVDA